MSFTNILPHRLSPKGLCAPVRSADAHTPGQEQLPTPYLQPHPQGQGLPELLCPRKEHPPLPGHSPGQLSALFLALWKGLFFFLFPWKGRHNPTTLRLIPDPEPYKNRLSPPSPIETPSPGLALIPASWGTRSLLPFLAASPEAQAAAGLSMCVGVEGGAVREAEGRCPLPHSLGEGAHPPF